MIVNSNVIIAIFINVTHGISTEKKHSLVYMYVSLSNFNIERMISYNHIFILKPKLKYRYCAYVTFLGYHIWLQSDGAFVYPRLDSTA